MNNFIFKNFKIKIYKNLKIGEVFRLHPKK